MAHVRPRGARGMWGTKHKKVAVMLTCADWQRPQHKVVLAHQRCAGQAVADGAHDSDSAATARALKAENGFTGPARAAAAVYRSEWMWDLTPLAHF
jgi:hypothetical protein